DLKLLNSSGSDRLICFKKNGCFSSMPHKLVKKDSALIFTSLFLGWTNKVKRLFIKVTSGALFINNVSDETMLMLFLLKESAMATPSFCFLTSTQISPSSKPLFKQVVMVSSTFWTFSSVLSSSLFISKKVIFT